MAKNENKKELAYLLYMQEVTQKEICKRVGIGSSKTLTSWIAKGSWKEKRAAKTITRTELVNKTLERIAEMLEGDAINADQLSKLAAMVERLDKKGSVVAYMEVFTDFGKWLQQLTYTNKDVTLEFLKMVNRYHDIFISQKLNN
jgi:transposase